MPEEDRSLRALSRAAAGAALLSIGVVACPAPSLPPAAPPGAPTASAARPAAQAPPPPARWVESGATRIGPRLPSGTLVLLGGRRALVAADGGATAETEPAPEPLVGLTEVVTPGGVVLAAHSRHGVFVLGDPLGPVKTLAHTTGDVEVLRIGAGPGVIAVWTSASARPRFLDVAGQPASMADLPPLPARHMAFRSANEGVAFFEGAGLHVTRDGGKTWLPVREGALSRRLRGLEVRDGAVLAALQGSKADSPTIVSVDIAAGRLGEAVELPRKPGVLEWITRTGQDPIRSAVESGEPLPSGDVVVAQNGLFAIIDPRTGLVRHTEDTPSPGDFQVRRAGDSLLFVGPLEDESETGPRYAVHSRVISEETTPDPRLFPENDPVLTLEGRPRVQVTESGAALISGSCDPKDRFWGFCVRQPDGSWKTVRPESGERSEMRAAPLAGGHVVYLRGMEPGEDPPRDMPRPAEADAGVGADAGPDAGPDAGASSPPDGEASPKDGGPLWLVDVSPCGEESTIAEIRIPTRVEGAQLRLRSIAEDQEHTIRLSFWKNGVDGKSVVSIAAVKPGPGVARVTARDLDEARGFGLVGRFGVSLDKDARFHLSTDGGASWTPLAVPPALTRERIERDATRMSRMGLVFDDFVRVGWGPDPEAPRSAPPIGGAPLDSTPGKPVTIRCSDVGLSQGESMPMPSVLAYSAERSSAAGPVRHADWTSGAGSALGAVRIEGGERGPSVRSSWVWFDPSEMGARPRKVTWPSHRGLGVRPLLQAVAVDQTQAAFIALGTGDDLELFTAGDKGAGKLEIPQAVTDYWGFDGTFGPGGRFAFRAGDVLAVAKPGGRSWAVTLDGDVSAAFGQPTDQGVAVLVSSSTWAAMKTLRPPAKVDDPARVDIDGWVAVGAAHGGLAALPACSADSKGELLRVRVKRAGSIEIDGSARRLSPATFAVRVDAGRRVCLAAISSALEEPGDRSEDESDRVAPQYLSDGAVGDFFRWDVVSGRAERVSPHWVRKLECRREGAP